MGKRLFAAIKLHPDQAFVAQFHAFQQKLKQNRIKWVEEENVHITLKFFGETPEKKIPEICNALAKACAGCSSFPLTLTQTGIFGSRYKPRVIWLNVLDAEPLHLLQQRIVSELEPIGFLSDRQNFVPHLTLGRINQIIDMISFQQSMDAFRNAFQHSEIINELILFESILKAEGPVYSEIERFSIVS